MSGLPRSFIKKISGAIGKDNIVTEASGRWAYGYDNSRKHQLPDAVVFPSSDDQVKAIIQVCNEFNVPLIARGSGTNTAGGTVPLNQGVVLSLEKMTKVIEIDADNRFIRVQPGITNRAVQRAVAGYGLFWPPDPTSADICTVGGNLAMNASGPHSLKYGSTREHVLGLTAYTGTGDRLQTGVLTTKGVVGYDLVRLLVGSEGTLGVITEATLKLTPLPQTRATLQMVYGDIHSASQAISAIMRQPITPSVLEFMDASAINIVRDHADMVINMDAGALLMIEVEGQTDTIDSLVDSVVNSAGKDRLIETKKAKTADETKQLWAMRKALSPALRKIAPNKLNEDIVVPISRIPDLIKGLEAISRRHNIPIVNFGHAGNGNIHVNLLYDSQDPEQGHNAEPCLSDVFDLVLGLNGTLSGEHGIGQEKRGFISREIDPIALTLMWQIKRQFDPKSLMNPGKIFPPEYWPPTPD